MESARGAEKKELVIWLLPAALLPCVASIFYFKLLGGSPLAQAVYFVTKIFTVIWPIMAYRYFAGRFSINAGSKKIFERNVVFGGLASGLMISAILLLIYFFTAAGDVVQEFAPAIKQKAVELGFLEHYILFSVFLSVIHSFIEEVYWRFCVYGLLRFLIRPGVAAPLSALFFASHHLVVLTEYVPLFYATCFSLAVAAGGWIWAIMYERQRSLIGAWISHMLVDIVIMTVGYFLIFS